MSHQDRVFFGNFVGILAALVVFAIVIYFIANTVTQPANGVAPANPMRDAVVEENIKRVGMVKVAGAAASASAAPAAARSGTDVYNASCMACHATGAAGAPKVGDNAAWAPRISKGVDGLLSSAISGINAMPPRGTCMSCSDDELRAAIEHMVAESQ